MIKREIYQPFCTAIVTFDDKEYFAKACEAMRYFIFDGVMCRGLAYDDSLANKEQMVDTSVFVSKIPTGEKYNAHWLDE